MFIAWAFCLSAAILFCGGFLSIRRYHHFLEEEMTSLPKSDLGMLERSECLWGTIDAAALPMGVSVVGCALIWVTRPFVLNVLLTF